MKRKWSVSKGDSPWVVMGLAFLLVSVWLLVLGSFPLTLDFPKGDRYTLGYHGWGDRLIGRKLAKYHCGTLA
jgi:hypothetical protein